MVGSEGIASATVLQVEFFGALCAVFVLWFVIAVLIAVWVYRDAESRGMSGALWLIVVLIGGLLGLIVYLIVRSDRPTWPPGAGYAPPPPAPPPSSVPAPNGACRSCGTALAAGVKFCSTCGTPR